MFTTAGFTCATRLATSGAPAIGGAGATGADAIVVVHGPQLSAGFELLVWRQPVARTRVVIHSESLNGSGFMDISVDPRQETRSWRRWRRVLRLRFGAGGPGVCSIG
jgi:hypothetical protein